jgi:hypothetical protein
MRKTRSLNQNSKSLLHVRTLAQLDMNVLARPPPAALGPLIPSPMVRACFRMMHQVNLELCDDVHFELRKHDSMNTY